MGPIFVVQWSVLHCLPSISMIWYDLHSSDNFRGSRIFFCLVNNTRFFHWFPSDKFYDIWTQQRWSVRRWKLSERNLENFTISGRFSKNAKIGKKFSDRHNSAMIKDRRKFTTKWSLYGMFSFHFYRGLYAAHKKAFSATLQPILCLCH